MLQLKFSELKYIQDILKQASREFAENQIERAYHFLEGHPKYQDNDYKKVLIHALLFAKQNPSSKNEFLIAADKFKNRELPDEKAKQEVLDIIDSILK